jgi:hypothetical protein
MTQLRHDALFVFGVPYQPRWLIGHERGQTIPSADTEPLSGSCGSFGLLRYDLRKWLSKETSI